MFDADGNVKDAVVEVPGGDIRFYNDMKLYRLLKADGTLIDYTNDQPVTLVTPGELTYTFDYSLTNAIAANLTMPESFIPDALTPIQMVYGNNFSLKQMIRENEEILHYLNDDLIRIEAPREADRHFQYLKDASGKITQTIVTQGNLTTTYDEGKAA